MNHVDPRIAGVLATAIALAACVQTPVVATIPVMPGPNKSFDAFAADQAFCQNYASAQTAPAVAAANNQALGGAILTTALGAAVGGAVGGGRAAGIGAASGAALGTAVGAGSSGFAQMSAQQQFDVIYGECMTAHGNSVPGFSPPPGTPPYQGASMGPPRGSMPPPGYSSPGYSSPGYPPPGYSSPGSPPPGYPPSGYSPPGYYPGAPVPPPPGY